MLSFLKFEQNNASGATIDILFGGPADAYVLGAREGLFEKYVSPERANIAQDHMDKDGCWTGVYLGSIGFAVNPKRLEALGLPIPTCWDDLLSPRLRGEISMANPVSSGTGYTVLATLAQMMGKDQAIEYLKALDSNILDYTRSGAMPGKLVGLGQIAVGILFSHDVLAFRQQGYDIDLVFPKEGTGFEIGGIAIVKGTSRLDEAKRFVDFMLSAEGQNLYAAMGEFRLPTNRSAAIPVGAVPFSKINVIEYDVTWAAIHKDELLGRVDICTQAPQEVSEVDRRFRFPIYLKISSAIFLVILIVVSSISYVSLKRTAHECKQRVKTGTLIAGMIADYSIEPVIMDNYSS